MSVAKKYVSKIDKEIDLLDYIAKEWQVKNVEPIEDGFVVKGGYMSCMDGIIIHPKTLTGAEYDTAKGSVFALINPKHKEYMEYGATQLVQAIYGLTKTQAKNKVVEFIEKQQGQICKKDNVEYECNSRGTPLKIWENLKILYDHKEITLQYNELKRCIESNQEWYMYDDFLTQINSDCRRTGLVLSKDDLWGFTSYIANTKAYNPIKQYLEDAHEKFKATNAEISELGKLLKTISYPSYYSQEDIKFNECMILKWLLTGAKMGLNNGSDNAEFSLVFKGKQGVGKTRWFRALMPKEHLKDFFKDGIQLDLSKKDDIIQATSYWLCELGELGGTMRKSDRDALKAWLTSPLDEVRTPYSRKAEKYPRRTFFACTVNDNEFLRDDTGNRRFVVIDVEKLDHTHNIDIDLMWGEVMELLLQGNITYLEQNEIEYNNHRNKSYMVKSDEQILLEEYLPFSQPKEQWGYITSTAISDYMQEKHMKTLKPARIGKALAAMGIEQEYTRIAGRKGRYYILPHIEGYTMPF